MTEQSLSRRQFRIAGHDIALQLPTDPDQILDDAATSDDGADPYWGILWDAAVDMSRCVLQTNWPPGNTALEIGSGAGLVGVAGLLAGLDVTFSDVVPRAVALAASNAAINGFPEASHQIVDWHDVPGGTFDVLLASDILYDVDQHSAILKFAGAALNPHGKFWVGDPGRQQAETFLRAAKSADWNVGLSDRELRQTDSTALADFQLIELSKG